MKFGNSVADILIIKHTIWLGCARTWQLYRTLSRGTVFSWAQCRSNNIASLDNFLSLVDVDVW